MSAIMGQADLQYLSREKNRHGRDVIYVRRNGKRIRVKDPEGTTAFARAYADAVDKLGASPSKRPKPDSGVRVWPKNTFGWLGNEYFKSKGEGEFLALDEESRRARRNDLEICFEIPLSDDDPDPMGNCPIKHLSAQKMKRMIEMKDGPGARTNRRKHLSALCSWAVENKHMPSNPVRDIKSGRAQKGNGYYTWLIPDVQQFLHFHRGQLQSADKRAGRRSRKAILALGLLLFAGTRRQDMVTLGKQNARGDKPGVLGDWLRYIPKKTIKIRREVSQKPMLPVLKAIITEMSDVLGDMTFLVTEQGKPFSEAGFGNWFRDRCDEAELPMCTAHGLKKAGATIAAENGATTRQLMAMFDWDSPRMAEVYTRAAEQKRLAGEAMFLISLDRTKNENCRTLDPVSVAPDKIGEISNG
jgi:site-specific recombinase XerD